MLKCGFCYSANGEIQYPTNDIFGEDWEIFLCEDCKAFYLAPLPSADQLARAYDESYYGEEEKKFSFPLIERILDYFRSSRARSLKAYLKDGDSVLDIGCGNGGFLKSLKSFGTYKLMGSELSENSAKRAAGHKDIQLFIGSLKNEDFENESIDLITLFHVFEHLTNPKDTLEFIQQKLKKNGTLVMSFPNVDSWQSKFFKGHWLHLDPPRHLFLFKPKDFIEIMREMGFELVKEKYFSMEQNPYGAVQSILNLFTRKRDVLFESLKGNMEYAESYRGWKLFSQRLFFMLSFPFFIITDIVASLFKKSATVELSFKKV